jgi:hypothetical protein
MSSVFLRRFLALAAVAAVVSLPAQAPADSARPANETEAEAELQLVVEEVTDRVEVKPTGTLRSDRGGALFSGMTVTNTSEKAMSGRLVVVIDGTGIEGLTAELKDGRLESGESYIEALPLSGKLRPGERSPSMRVDFQAAKPVAAAARRNFALKARVFQIAAQEHEPDDPVAAADENLPGKNYSQKDLDRVMEIQNKWTKKLMEHEDVFGTGTAENEQGELVVQVFTQRSGVIKELPGQVDGVDLEQTVTGTMFRAGPAWTRVIEVGGKKTALGRQDDPEPTPETNVNGPRPAKPGPTAVTPAPGSPPPLAPTDPTIRFERPVPIGSSIFNLQDPLSASGTLGARVVFPDGSLGILSNAHVLAQENSGAIANPLTGTRGNDIIQPGSGDLGGATDIVGQLIDFQTLVPGLAGPPNLMDAAVARIDGPSAEDLVSACTPFDGYGFPSRDYVAPALGMRIQKFGRTTGYREGSIDALNVNAVVGYTNLGDVYFTGQFLSNGDGLSLGAPGDSGSLVVTKKGNKPVGLLFAGAGFRTVMNPIEPVLERFNIAIDDGSMTPPRPGPNSPTRDPGQRGTGRMGRSGGRIEP